MERCAAVLMPESHANNGNPVQWPSCSCQAPTQPKSNSRALTLWTDNTLCLLPVTQECSQSQLTQRVVISQTPAHLLPGLPDLVGHSDSGCKAKNECFSFPTKKKFSLLHLSIFFIHLAVVFISLS